MDLNELPQDVSIWNDVENQIVDIGGGIEELYSVENSWNGAENQIIVIDGGTKEPHSAEDLPAITSACEPYVGMVFDSLEQSREFWNKYGRVSGFSTKIRSTKKSKGKTDVVNSRDYACSREGKKAKDERTIASKKRSETRCGCLCIMKVRLIQNTNKFKVTSFVKDHNHPLEDQLAAKYLRSHRHITDVQAKAIDVATAAGIGPKTTHRYMSLEAGGSSNVGFIPEDIRSYLRSQRKKVLKVGEASTILQYFRDKKKVFPSFFHDYQYDCLGKLTNIFWADSRMIVDYQAFGDVVMFDTTFGTNKASRPLGIFTGFNNHRQCVVFGGCLLFDETIPSFAWAFKVFLDCHGGKNPIVIFTDQDAAMKHALQVVMPNVRHCLCSWHIIHNVTNKLSKELHESWPHFLKYLKECMYETCKVEKFEHMWKCMTEKYNLVENKWLVRLYNLKEQWSVAYRMNIFSAGVRSTQLVESVNGRLKRELGTGITMKKFFKGFDFFLDGVRERERKSDVKCRQSSPHVPLSYSKILNHAALVYTPRLFNRFSKQFDKMHNILLNEMNVIQGPHVRNAFYGNRIYQITYDHSSVTISCACCMFERCGYLCAHILRVFDVCGIHTIPDKYIVKRWTRHARSGFANINALVPELSDAEKVVMMMSNFSRLAYRTKGKQVYVDRIMKFITGEEDFIDKNETPEVRVDDVATETFDNMVTGLKAKENNKGCRKRRERSCLEKSKGRTNTQNKKRKTPNQVTGGHLDNDKDINLYLKF